MKRTKREENEVLDGILGIAMGIGGIAMPLYSLYCEHCKHWECCKCGECDGIGSHKKLY
ncbi:hypothetical protein HZC31_03400 [Candidatus Woesearchaeota archaeon]|nr:hypothetical protein [Candidatus Woesearchaeota archaeon]